MEWNDMYGTQALGQGVLLRNIGVTSVLFSDA